ncbi:motif of rad21/Rec8-like protein [Rhizoctonia solani 123E]|uniref:Motif of rad21/Rec8-like protein n=1 Tax=Rhizoctonia solani 123E TaxID=1423351 RepID=A0A074SCH3_9AGAM|nr:motif of rad21/Rec8-like protein [Rhizoctonia solani 123E]
MFYSEAILSRRGPLGKVWLAAHWERKLSKNQTLQTDISESVDAILGQEIVPMALRLSGQLLLGVCRIYSRKAKYLLDDCNEALLKIRLAFRPGIVDMTEDQLQVPRNAITLSGEGLDIDLLMPDMNWDLDFVATQVPATTQNIARAGDITLANAGDITLALDDTGYGFDLGPLDGIGSQDIDFDLGLDLDIERAPSARDDEGDETMSLEAPRDAPAPRSARESLASGFRGHGDDDLDRLSQRSRSKTRELTFEPEAGPGFDVTGMDIDLDGGLDLGIGFEEQGPTPGVVPATPAAPAGPEDTTQLEGEKTPLADRSRASTPLSEPPPTPGAGDVLPGITPKTAERISKKAEETEKLSGRKKTTTKKLVVDSVAELAEERRGRRDEDLSAIQTEQQFLPNNTTVARLLEIRADPIAHFLPTKTTPNGTFFCAAPPGLPPALAEMFMFPTTNLRRPRGATPVATPGALQTERDEEEELRTPKRARISVPGEEPEVEYGRHREPSERAPSERPFEPDVTIHMSEGFEGFGGLGDDQPFNIGNVTLEMSTRQPSLPKSRAQSLAADDEVRSRYSTPGPGRRFEDVECPIATFDHRAKGAEAQTQMSESDAMGEGQIKGVSKNTAKALALLQDQLQPDETGEDKVLSFAQVSTKATRRAASAFFFELLLLSTRDCVKVSQDSEFANIEVRAKDRLWEQHVPAPGEVDPGREATPSVSSVIEGEMD